MGSNLSHSSPPWMVNLKNLVSISFMGCERCSHISALGKLPNNLKDISISIMNLVRLHDENNTTSAGGILFPSLESLYISSCMNFVSLPSNLPKLKRLTIEFCPALHSFPEMVCKVSRNSHILRYRDVKI
ncbi:hypothetical protein OSB04_013922 [Centaurea solstitialis]|uniref:Uncharacterized protein n=1 Tax=Centaurea solstitialis TaxID=347529 RepID=A0AA38TLQ2_9ASTR|nr:hypothetical protein OSB04_013922 [Centaurea solstitialis]